LTAVQIVYFASVREAIGMDGEQADFPPDVVTVADCLTFLAAHGGVYPAAFADTSKLRFALDQQMVKIDAPITGARELAIFPPVTGG
jgi:sulfur-carrier protein